MQKFIFSAFTLIILLLTSCSEPHIRFITPDRPEEVFDLATQKNQPVFLYLRLTDDLVADVLENDVFRDEQIAKTFNASFVCVKGNADEEVWKSLGRQYAVRNYPVMLLLEPSGRLMNEISQLGAIGKDKDGELACRKPILSQATLASRFTESDRSYFDNENWARMDASAFRVDGSIFTRAMRCSGFLRRLYSDGYPVFLDYNFGNAAVQLLNKPEDMPAYLHEGRYQAFLNALDSAAVLDTALSASDLARFRYYGDINIAFGLEDSISGLAATEEALAAGAISEEEALQMRTIFSE